MSSQSSASSSSSSSSSCASVIFRFLLLELEPARVMSEASFLTGVSGRREEEAVADDDDETTGMGDADVVLVMMGDDVCTWW